MADDLELLREYVERGAENAFRTLVERHAPMVYGTALRVLANGALAEEATQATFIVLARKAARIRRGTIVAGWLYRTARFVALEARRTETRREQRQENFLAMNNDAESIWREVSPFLDDALHRLGTADRDALVLRFFNDKSFADVAQALGTSEAAAKMRVARAIEKLRTTLAREGFIVSAIALAAAFEANSGPVLPAQLISSNVSAALAASGASNTSLTTLVTGALQIMAWNKLRNTALVAALVLLLGGGAGIMILKNKSHAPRAVTVNTFEPMTGEWEGTFEMSGDGFARPIKQNASLSIRSAQGGRSCQIEMRVLAPDGAVGRIYNFTHSLNDTGDRVITLDDPNIARPLGEGVVMSSSHDARTGEWRAGFHAALPNNGGSTDCEWSRHANELTIVRHDYTVTPQGKSEVISELRLRRAGSAKL